MENISYIGLSQQKALQEQMNVASNNIANMSTPGYKGTSVIFEDYLNRAKHNDPTGIKQVSNIRTYRDLSQGSLQRTDNKLDFAINGEGYFSVQTPQGQRYTRDGSFSLDANGNIVTKEGYQVMGDSGPLSIPQGARNIVVGNDGNINTDQGDVGSIRVVNFADGQSLTPEGDNLLSAGQGAVEQPAEKVTITQGSLEMANVNPIIEMNRMVEILRNYQAAQKMIQNDHDRIRSVIQKLTQV